MITGIVVASFVSALLAGCSTGGSMITQTNDAGHILMSDARHADAVSGDEVEGTLTLIGSCFGLDTGVGDFVAVFPQGSGIIEGTDQIEIPGWGTLRLDDRYQGGGAIHDSSTLSYHDNIPAECRAGRVLVLYPLR